MKKKILLAVTPLLLGVIGCSPMGNFHPVGDIGEKISIDDAKKVAREIIQAQASSTYQVHDSAKIDIKLSLSGSITPNQYSASATGKALFSNTHRRVVYNLDGYSISDFTNLGSARYLVEEARAFYVGDDDVYYVTTETDVTPDVKDAATSSFKQYATSSLPTLDAEYYLVGGGQFSGPQKWQPIGGYALEEVTSEDPNIVSSYTILNVRFTAYDQWAISDATGENKWGATIATGTAFDAGMSKLANGDILVNTTGKYDITFNVLADDTYTINVSANDSQDAALAVNNNTYWSNAQNALGFPTGNDALTLLDAIQTEIDRNPTQKNYANYNFYSNGEGSLYINYLMNDVNYAMQFVNNEFVYGIVRVRSTNSSLYSVREYIISYEDVTLDELDVPTIDDTWTNIDNPFDDYPNQEVEEEGGIN